MKLKADQLKIKNASGDFGGNKIENIAGQIFNMKSDNPILKLNGILNGDLQRIIDSANKSPVEKWLKNFTTSMTGKGLTDLDLFLNIDLKTFKTLMFLEKLL